MCSCLEVSCLGAALWAEIRLDPKQANLNSRCKFCEKRCSILKWQSLTMPWLKLRKKWGCECICTRMEAPDWAGIWHSIPKYEYLYWYQYADTFNILMLSSGSNIDIIGINAHVIPSLKQYNFTPANCRLYAVPDLYWVLLFIRFGNKYPVTLSARNLCASGSNSLQFCATSMKIKHICITYTPSYQNSSQE